MKKSTIALCAIGWGYTATNERDKQKRILIAARKKVHYMNGLPEPTKNLRYIESFISQYVQSTMYGVEWPIEKKSRNRKTQVEKIQLEHPKILHLVWGYTEKTIGKKA